MNENYIKKLIRLVEESKVESLEVSSWGRKVKITQRGLASSNGHSEAPVVMQPVAAPQTAAPAPSAPAPQPAAEADNGDLVEVTSPMVGTFYAAPAPDADPYVSLNQKISKGQVVCIVEAMKLMNEIEAEVSGRIAKVLVENGQPVEYGQVMFLIEPD